MCAWSRSIQRDPPKRAIAPSISGPDRDRPVANTPSGKEATMFTPELERLAFDAEQALQRQRERLIDRDIELAWHLGLASRHDAAPTETLWRRLARLTARVLTPRLGRASQTSRPETGSAVPDPAPTAAK
jgi:hypothetical protein